MRYLLCFISLLSIISPTYGAYIDTRDLSEENNRIQRLLGQLEGIKITPAQSSSSGINGTQIAMLGMITSGLAITVASSYSYYRPYNYYHRSSYYSSRYSHGYRRSYNSTGTAIGTTIAAAGLIGLIASAASANNAQQSRQNTIQKQQQIEKEINTIVSNLVATDEDFDNENNSLNQQLANSVDKNIKKIAERIDRDVKILKAETQQKTDEFKIQTNQIAKDIVQLEQNLFKNKADYITKLDNPSISKKALKEYKALNKELAKFTKKQTKELKSVSKKETKKFNKSFPKFQEEISANILLLEQSKDSRILKEVTIAEKLKSNLFQKYINLYINELSVY